MTVYHDTEWGVPEHDDRMLFELLTLEGAQAGLSWATILKRRENYRTIFVHFEIEKVARFTNKQIETALLNPGIIRNRAKVLSTVNNAQRIVELREEFKSFDAYLWNFVNDVQIVVRRADQESLPAESELSARISKDLKKRGFAFVGPTIIYSYLQAIGIIDDHYASCHRSQKLL
jgi:DNA-3-methyladenine glycosylase I